MPKLEDFIAHARSKGMDHQTIRMLLLSNGWKEKDISSALASETLDMAVPLPRDTGSAKDAFFHLLTFTTLYATVGSLVVLAFQYIGRWFPDAALYDPYQATAAVSAIRWGIAVIVVAFPIFVFISRVLHREYLHTPEKLASGVRRWLTYLTLFVTACALIGDGITLLFFLLNGELSIRFLLKVLAILILSGVPFFYYFSVLRMDAEQYAKSVLHSRVLWISMLITVAFVAYGVFLAGSPLQGRRERFDEIRVNDLRAIDNQIMNIVYGRNPYEAPPVKIVTLPKPLPKTLADVAASATYEKLSTQDPETGEPYEYIVSGTKYQLCAVFTLTRALDYDIFWNHSTGKHCFQFDALSPEVK